MCPKVGRGLLCTTCTWSCSKALVSHSELEHPMFIQMLCTVATHPRGCHILNCLASGIPDVVAAANCALT